MSNSNKDFLILLFTENFGTKTYHGFHENNKQHNSDINKHQISILKSFLKDHVTLKTCRTLSLPSQK